MRYVLFLLAYLAILSMALVPEAIAFAAYEHEFQKIAEAL